VAFSAEGFEIIGIASTGNQMGAARQADHPAKSIMQVSNRDITDSKEGGGDRDELKAGKLWCL
jgi:hypothetical protein